MAITTDPTGKAAPSGGFQTGGWYSGYQYWDGSFAPKAGMIHSGSNQQGAGQMVSPEVNAQTSIAAGKPASSNQTYIDNLNAGVPESMASPESLASSADLASYLNKYQGSLMTGLDSVGNTKTLDQLKSSLAPSTSLPAPLDRATTRQGLMDQYGIKELETQLNTLKTDEQAIRDQLKATTGAEEGKTVAMNVISGRITEEERVANIRLNDILRSKDSVVNELTTKYNIINTYMTDIGLDYQDAVERYNTEFTQNFQIQTMFNGLQETAFNQAMDMTKLKMSNAQANLTTITNAITSGNVNYNALPANTKLQIQKLEMESGLPVGFTATLKADPKTASDNIIGTYNNDGLITVVMKGADGSPYIKTMGERNTSTGTLTPTQINAAKQKVIQLGGTTEDQNRVATDIEFYNWVMAQKSSTTGPLSDQ